MSLINSNNFIKPINKSPDPSPLDCCDLISNEVMRLSSTSLLIVL